MKVPHQQEGPVRRLALDLPAVHAAVRQARQAVRTFAKFDGMTGDECEHLTLVVAELLSNAVDHGGGGGAVQLADQLPGVRMELDLELAIDHWTVTVRDQGEGDAAKLAPKLDEELPDLTDDRGRGLFLLQAMVDELTIGPRKDRDGLEVRVTKKVSPAGPVPDED